MRTEEEKVMHKTNEALDARAERLLKRIRSNVSAGMRVIDERRVLAPFPRKVWRFEYGNTKAGFG